jgi:hypothetical protein
MLATTAKAAAAVALRFGKVMSISSGLAIPGHDDVDPRAGCFTSIVRTSCASGDAILIIPSATSGSLAAGRKTAHSGLRNQLLNAVTPGNRES